MYTNGVLMLFRGGNLFALFRWHIFILDTISDKPLEKRNRLSSRQIILFALFNLSLCISPPFLFSLFVCMFLSSFLSFFLSFVINFSLFFIYFSLSFFICFSISLCISIFLFYLCLYLSWSQYPSDKAAVAGKHDLGFILLQKNVSRKFGLFFAKLRQKISGFSSFFFRNRTFCCFL